jgi:hypothetical protein
MMMVRQLILAVIANGWYPLPRAGIAQSVEHLICNQGVAGSNPAAGTSVLRRASPFQRLLAGWTVRHAATLPARPMTTNDSTARSTSD